ncbi:MAG TPA: protein kinase, partial [Blastocatellia bacterium]|nr:protein kinase [Blastocatellia bacterium]
TRLSRKVAIKLLPHVFTLDKERISRFKQEARAASALNHPNIVTIHEIGETDGLHFIAMEYVDGQTLRSVLENGPIRLAAAVDIAAQAAGALAAAHAAGIVHRDIKPENLMLRPDGYVKLLDFGLAKLIEKRSTDDALQVSTLVSLRTHPGTVMGTVNYMSPEQTRGQEVDARTDVFSLGVVLYEMVAGRSPFDAETAADVTVAILCQEPASLLDASHEVPEELYRIVMRALRKDRRERYQMIAELGSDLKRLKQRLDFDAQPVARIQPFPSKLGTAIQPEAPSSPTVDPEVQVRRNKETIKGGDIIKLGTAIGGKDVTSADAHQGARGASASRSDRRRLALIAASFAVLIATIGVGLWRYQWRNGTSRSAEMRPKQLTNVGNVMSTALSPDGERFVYNTLEPDGRETLWLGRVDGGDAIKLLEPNEIIYEELVFSSDGENIYYNARYAYHGTLKDTFKISLADKSCTKMREEFKSLSFCPKSNRIAFSKRDKDKGIWSLFIANDDLSNRRELIVRPADKPLTLRPNAWSPDGTLIALIGKRETDTTGSEIFVVRVDDGQVTQLTSASWTKCQDVAWLRDGTGLVVSALKDRGDFYQVYSVSYPSGAIGEVTRDNSAYSSLTAGINEVLGVEALANANIWVAPAHALHKAKQITYGSLIRRDGLRGLDWTADGKLVYTRYVDHSWTLWMMESDGSNQQPLTNPGNTDRRPSTSRDGRYMVFRSDRSGAEDVWRIDADGRNPIPLTDSGGNVESAASPDGKWVVYQSSRDGLNALWRVSIDGGEPVRLTERRIRWPGVSPDSKLIACGYDVGESELKLAILPIDGRAPIKAPLKLFDLPRLANLENRIHWTPDQTAVSFADRAYGVWLQPLNRGVPHRLEGLPGDSRIYSYAWSQDGSQFAYTTGYEIRDVLLIRALK